MLRIAIPNKGALSEPAQEMLKEAGYRSRSDHKDLTVVDSSNGVEFFYLRPKELLSMLVMGSLILALPAVISPSNRRLLSVNALV